MTEVSVHQASHAPRSGQPALHLRPRGQLNQSPSCVLDSGQRTACQGQSTGACPACPEGLQDLSLALQGPEAGAMDPTCFALSVLALEIWRPAAWRPRDAWEASCDPPSPRPAS